MFLLWTDCLDSVGRSVFGDQLKRTVSVIVEIDELVAPLSDDSERVFQEGDNDEKAANRWKISTAISISKYKSKKKFGRRFNMRKAIVCNRECDGEAYGFTGSDNVSSQSSILLVCSRIASRGLGSLVASARPGPPNRLS